MHIICIHNFLPTPASNRLCDVTCCICINQFFFWQWYHREQLCLSILSNTHRIRTLGDNSYPFVCSRCLWPLRNLYSYLLNIISLVNMKKRNMLILKAQITTQVYRSAASNNYLPAMNF